MHTILMVFFLLYWQTKAYGLLHARMGCSSKVTLKSKSSNGYVIRSINHMSVTHSSHLNDFLFHHQVEPLYEGLNGGLFSEQVLQLIYHCERN